ncbi:MAG TPA: hypothetical protein VHK01_12040 [Lacipirellulaceae bacterium]|nr:hypothetical protein [Lacipirellulaceae bacterium]
MQKSLDEKLSRIAANPAGGDFILADAKDADMAFGIAAPGMRRNKSGEIAGYRNIQEFREQIREIVRQQLVDIMLMSVSTSDAIAVHERLFDESPVTPAIRANDTTDIWLAGRDARYGEQPSLPFRTATLDEAMGVGVGSRSGSDRPIVDLGLYSITLNNDATLDRATLQGYGDFRQEARGTGFRHFLEVFAPNAANSVTPDAVPRFVNDSIARLLAGIPASGRPLFLKMPYFGPAALEELVSYDSSLVVGILGGSAGTTFDAFNMLWEAKKHGARAALFGRKINNAEHQLSFVKHLRALADGQAKPADAVRSYHEDLANLKIVPHRPLAEDLEPSSPAK